MHHPAAWPGLTRCAHESPLWQYWTTRTCNTRGAKHQHISCMHGGSAKARVAKIHVGQAITPAMAAATRWSKSSASASALECAACSDWISSCRATSSADASAAAFSALSRAFSAAAHLPTAVRTSDCKRSICALSRSASCKADFHISKLLQMCPAFVMLCALQS